MCETETIAVLQDGNGIKEADVIVDKTESVLILTNKLVWCFQNYPSKILNCSFYRRNITFQKINKQFVVQI
jgi:hypothetical protein